MFVTLWDQGLVVAQWGVVIFASLIGAICDLRSSRIPNLLTVPVLVGGIVWAGWVGALPGLADATAGCVLLSLPYVLLFVFGGGGAGDAKLMGSIGAWLGVVNASVTLVAVTMSGLVLAVGFALAKGRFRRALANLVRMCSIVTLYVFSRGRSGEAQSLLVKTGEMQTIPYGVGIFVGTCVAAVGVFAWRAY